ncbi:response regulator transcription factor [Roseateles aquatilis]|uniref:response regulator transcription factor n=1 Tax=Roseateles aquatilis TaxID=431061 RepID=UPI0026CBCF27|nr:response regulator transcription factor [Roseateles aquatilis]
MIDDTTIGRAWGGERARDGWRRLGGPDGDPSPPAVLARLQSGAGRGGARVSCGAGAGSGSVPVVEERMTRCLVVDDDAEIRDSLQDYLQKFGVTVSTAADGREMRRLMTAQAFDVVVLDLMLPDENGLTLCQWIQQHHANVPVIMLTAHGDPISRVLGLEMGADDYLSKPFEPRELVARIHAIRRRARRGESESQTRREVRFEGWSFDRLLRQLVSPQQVVVPLSSAEFRMLTALVERPGRVLSREQLIELTRAPGVEVNDRSVDLTISRLRQKLGDSPKEPRLIRTMRGEGYLFDAQVQS